ncbi:MAG: acyltransferase family protein [Sedimenticola sp.]
MDYRAEIDGFRSLAVLAVIIYHLKLELGGVSILPGGFLGVDIFFVLSGFLISKIILLELDTTNSFSFRNFYTRRVRRILPPLLLVILVMLPVAWMVLLPSELERFAHSLVGSIGFFSNIFWFLHLSEYGAQSALLQPFLHTWSLSIEEQFYIFFPIMLVMLYGWISRKGLGITLSILIVVFLALCVITTDFHKGLSFYSPVSRAWELLAGALMGFVSLHRPQALQGYALSRFIPGGALVILLVWMATVHLEDVAHPGFITIPVIVATCALLWFATPDEPITRFFSMRGPVWIGKLSYSLYLWHFPVFAFGRQMRLDQPTAMDMLFWIALSFILAWLGYHFVERPFRFQLPLRLFFRTIVAVIAIILIFSAVVTLEGGFPTRFSGLASVYGKNEFDNERLRDQSWMVLSNLSDGEEIYAQRVADKPSAYEIRLSWYTSPDSYKVLVVGNSHSKDMFNALHLNQDRFNNTEFARFGMSADFTQDQLDKMLKAPNFVEADAIAIAPRYSRAGLERLPEVLKQISATGKTVYVIGNTSEFISPGKLPVFDWHIRRGGHVDASEINHLAYNYEADNKRQRNKKVKEIAREAGVHYLSRRSLICSDTTKNCALLTPEGLKTMFDYGHWTLAGARYFGAQAALENWFQTEMTAR